MAIPQGWLYGNGGFAVPGANPLATGGGGPFANFIAAHSPPAAAPAGTSPLPGGPVTGYNPAVGGVPSAPNPQGTQAAAMLGNLAALANLLNLSKGVGAASGAGAAEPYKLNLPGWENMTKAASANTQSLLGGEIPADTMAMLNQQAAERGVATGSPDSPNANAAALRAMGLTSLDLKKLGDQQLTAAVGRTPTGPAFNPASMLVDPNMQTALQWLANQLAAAPVPAAAAGANLNSLGNAFDRARNTAANPNMGWLSDMASRYLPPSTVPKPLDPGYPMGPNQTVPNIPDTYDYSGMPDYEYPELYDPSFDYSMGGLDTSGYDPNSDFGFDYPELTDTSSFYE